MTPRPGSRLTGVRVLRPLASSLNEEAPEAKVARRSVQIASTSSAGIRDTEPHVCDSCTLISADALRAILLTTDDSGRLQQHDASRRLELPRSTFTNTPTPVNLCMSASPPWSRNDQGRAVAACSDIPIASATLPAARAGVQCLLNGLLRPHSWCEMSMTASRPR